MLDAELVEDADDDTADVVLAAVGFGQRVEEQVQAALGIALVERLEGLLERRFLAFQADARRETFGGERAGDLVEDLQRRVFLAAAGQHAAERRGATGAAGRQRQPLSQRLLAAARDEPVGLAGDELVEEALDGGRRL